jgi:hypothetical protein
MDRDLDIWVVVVAAASTAAVLIQFGFLLALFLGIRRLRVKMKGIRSTASASGSGVQEWVTTLREASVAINRVAKNTVDLTERIKPVVDEAVGVVHRQLVRADQVLTDVLTRVERISAYVEEVIVQPAGEIRAFAAAVRAALTVFFHHPNHGKGHQELSGDSNPGPHGRTPLGPTVLLLILNLSVLYPARLCARQARGQASYEGEKVALVDLVVRPGTDVEALKPLILQKAGEPYSNEKVQNSVAALKQTGGFSKVDVEVTPEPAGLRVAFIIQPAFYIGMIEFPGAVHVLSYPRLLQAVNYPAQEPYEASRVKGAEADLLHFLANNGYFQARVETEIKLNEAHELVDVVFHVTLNKRARFGRVEVIGPARKEAARLEQALSSSRARLKGASLKSGKPYDPKRLEAATKFIRDYLGKEDRLASQVRLKEPHYDPETNRTDVAFQVTLGPTVAVRVEGARLSKRTLRKLIPIYEENAFDQDLVAEGQRNLVSYFRLRDTSTLRSIRRHRTNPRRCRWFTGSTKEISIG